ncbi:hypothetical protein D5H75_40505 [Bailinhaonella thermotolerans]|uniref:Uncharacterized protein n=1 Tax=Bailinhaonella thermotolerans TaxID=1070861 RepID=A0A3A4A3R8_9ACTN|nr:hypothetical protein D5H75_40505 [Bailinhaonella thermotolerans]
MGPAEERAVRKLAIGLDLPPELLLGLGDSNHWSAWQIEESGVNVHVTPLLTLLCEAITSQVYRHAIADLVSDPDEYAIFGDTSELTRRQGRGEALELHDRGLLSDAALLREYGYDLDDLPDREEGARILARRLAVAHPALAPMLLPRLGIDVPAGTAPAEVVVRERATVEAVEAPPQEDRRELPASDAGATLPATPATTAAAGVVLPREDAGDARRWLLATLEMATVQALERAGRRLVRSQPRSQRGQYSQIPPAEVHRHLAVQRDDLDHILAGAYPDVPALAATPCVRQLVDDYVRALLLGGRPHQRRYLEAALAQSECADIA